MIIDKIKRIKYARLHPNDVFLIESFNDIIPHTHKQHNNSTFYIKNDIIIFEKHNNEIWINSNFFWKDIIKNLPVRIMQDEREKLIIEFLNYHLNMKCDTLYTTYAKNKKWKHILRSIDSIDRKKHYVK